MLYIVRQCDVDSAKTIKGDSCAPYTYTWIVGQKKPTMCGDITFTDVCEVQADGGELAYIRRHFKNLPDCDAWVVTWKGAMAQFIYDHLRHQE